MQSKMSGVNTLASISPTKEELQQVEWLMNCFLNVDRYKVLLDLCKSRGIKSKRGKDFNKNNIRSLLNNTRYIGKWYRNKHNAGKRQSRLMPYERYTEVKLDHGCVIDESLWQRVQDKIKELDESRTQATKRCYPLSGLLYFAEGSNFTGSVAWGQTRRSTYYQNKTNKLMIRTEIFESEAEKVLHKIAENTPDYQKSIADYSARKDSSIQVAAGKIVEIDARLREIATERQRLDRRLSFLLEGGDIEVAQSFRDTYMGQFSDLKSERYKKPHEHSEWRMKVYAFGFLLHFTEDWAKDLLVILESCRDILTSKNQHSSKAQQ